MSTQKGRVEVGLMYTVLRLHTELKEGKNVPGWFQGKKPTKFLIPESACRFPLFRIFPSVEKSWYCLANIFSLSSLISFSHYLTIQRIYNAVSLSSQVTLCLQFSFSLSLNINIFSLSSFPFLLFLYLFFWPYINFLPADILILETPLCLLTILSPPPVPGLRWMYPLCCYRCLHLCKYSPVHCS